MKIEYLYNQGSDLRKEDFIIDLPGKIFGVLDTGSGVFIPPAEPQMFHGMTGGQYAGIIIKDSINQSVLHTNRSPEETMMTSNNALAAIFQRKNLDMAKPEDNPFASYALGFSTGNNIEIFQGGDCQFVWQAKNGNVGWTINQTLIYEKENLRMIKKEMKKYACNRIAMWQKFGPILKERRRKFFNSSRGKFSLLNGQPSFCDYWQRATLKASEIETIIGYTDGFVVQSETTNMSKLARGILETYQNYGLQAWLDATHKIAKAQENETHISLPEATAIAIEP